MTLSEIPQVVIFQGARCIARGPLAEAAARAAQGFGVEGADDVLVFDAESSRPVDIDWRGTPAEIAARLRPAGTASEAAPTRGRPRLGVVAREVTLLPRHWDWLAEQPGGASVTLRKLIDQARQNEGEEGRRRRARDATYRFMTAMAGNAAGYEEALRALYAGDAGTFERLVSGWPEDIARHCRELAALALG